MRLFVAINFPDDIKDALCGVTDELRKSGVTANFSGRDTLHLTLAFLGETAPSRLPDLKRAMDSLHFAPFELTLSSPGRFKRSGGDILWIGLTHSAALQKLQRELIASLKQSGFSPDDKPFKPHLTIAREAVNAPRIPETASGMTCDVRSVELMRSDRVNGRMVYTPIYSIKSKDN